MAAAGSTAARRYAEAAFQLATRDDAVDAYAAGLDLAASTLAREGVLDVLRNPAQPLRGRTEVVDRLLAEPRGLLTLLTGEDAPELDELLAAIGKRHPDVEIEVQEGGQPHYPLLLSAE